MTYYEKMKNARKKSGLTQEDVALKMNTTKQQISKYENGIQEMTILKFTQYCKIINASADEILGVKEK